jgi:hypothetical protein
VALPTWNSLVTVAKDSCYTIENLFSLSSTTLKAKKSALHLAAVSGASCVLRYLLEHKPQDKVADSLPRTGLLWLDILSGTASHPDASAALTGLKRDAHLRADSSDDVSMPDVECSSSWSSTRHPVPDGKEHVESSSSPLMGWTASEREHLGISAQEWEGMDGISFSAGDFLCF